MALARPGMRSTEMERYQRYRDKRQRLRLARLTTLGSEALPHRSFMSTPLLAHGRTLFQPSSRTLTSIQEQVRIRDTDRELEHGDLASSYTSSECCNAHPYCR